MNWPTRQLVAARLDQLGLLAVATLGAWGAANLLAHGLPMPAAISGLVCAAGILGFRRARDRARRGLIGRESERVTVRVLRALEADGWEIRNSVRWPGRGDVDHIAIPSTGPVFVIDTKTSRYDANDLRRAVEASEIVAQAWHRQAILVICLARRNVVDAREGAARVVSADRLASMLSREAP